MAVEPLFPAQPQLTYRRYLLLKMLSAYRNQLPHIAAVWRSQLQELSGTLLPTNFPLRSELAIAGYTTREDFAGATAAELVEALDLTQGIIVSQIDTEAVLASYAALPAIDG